MLKFSHLHHLNIIFASFVNISLVLETSSHSTTPILRDTPSNILENCDTIKYTSNSTEDMSSMKRPFKVVFWEGTNNSLDLLPGNRILSPDGNIHRKYSFYPFLWDFQEILGLCFQFKAGKEFADPYIGVSRGEADLGILAISTTYHIEPGAANLSMNGQLPVHYLQPSLSFPTSVFFQHPSSYSYNDILTRPFSNASWLTLALCWLISIGACFAMYKYYESESWTETKSQTVIWGAAIIYGKSYPEFTCNNTSVKLTLASAMILNLICSAVYTGNIVAFFSLNQDVIKSPEDLLHYKYTFGSTDVGHFSKIFKGLKFKYEVAVKSVQFLHDTWDQTMQMLLRINGHKMLYAFLSDPDHFIFPLRHSKIDAGIVCDKISSFKSEEKSTRSMYMYKNSPFRENISVTMMKLMERGIRKRHQTHQFDYEYFYECLEKSNYGFTQVTFVQTFSIFCIIVSGFFLAIFIEIYYYYNARRRFVMRRNILCVI